MASKNNQDIWGSRYYWKISNWSKKASQENVALKGKTIKVLGTLQNWNKKTKVDQTSSNSEKKLTPIRRTSRILFLRISKQNKSQNLFAEMGLKTAECRLIPSLFWLARIVVGFFEISNKHHRWLGSIYLVPLYKSIALS